MSETKIIMPNMGESIIECTVLKWLIKEGDEVKEDDMILEVATDKIDTEIGSPYSGIINKFLVKEGEIVEIGKPICTISTLDEVQEEEDETFSEDIMTDIPGLDLIVNDEPSSTSFYSPLVLKIAEKEGISLDTLSKIKGSGLKGRLTKDDLLDYINSGNGIVTQSSSGDTIVEMDRMRKMIASRMVESVKISPHVTTFIETDMTRIVSWRNKNKDVFQDNYDQKLTITPFLVSVVARALKKYPYINSQVQGDNIILKKDINIGLAVALANGNLIVPVIRNADQMNLLELTIKVNDLANRARENNLKPDELAGATFTISNIGSFGSLTGTPIISQPQVAILAFGTILKKPAVIETPQGDTIGIRHKMITAHTFDHRIIDGALGSLFLKYVSDGLEEYDLNNLI